MHAESQIIDATPHEAEVVGRSQLDRLIDVIVGALERSSLHGIDPDLVIERLGARLWARFPRRPRGGPAVLRLEGLEVDLLGHEVRSGEHAVRLTRREFALLAMLVEESDRVLSRDEIFERVWGAEEAYSRRTVDIHIHRLRRKLRAPFSDRLETYRGVGYKLRSTPLGAARD